MATLSLTGKIVAERSLMVATSSHAVAGISASSKMDSSGTETDMQWLLLKALTADL